MKRYLIVAHQTAESPELAAKVDELVKADTTAEFTILVPATPVQHLLTWWEGEKQAIAEDQGQAAAERLRKAGARVDEVQVGDASPTNAIGDELRRRPGHYAALIVCTLPQGLSRWLQLDLLSQAQRIANVPIIHVEAQPVRATAKS